MWTLFIIFGLMPVLVFIKLTAQRWHFRNGAEKIDMEKELYSSYSKVREREAGRKSMRNGSCTASGMTS